MVNIVLATSVFIVSGTNSFASSDFHKDLTAKRYMQRIHNEFTDFVLICGPKRFPVHKFVVCGHSTILQEFCHSTSSGDEYLMPKDSPEMVERMVEYFYTGSYTNGNEIRNTQGNNNGSSTPIRIHTEMSAIAYKYGVEGLEALAATRYEDEALSCSIKDILETVVDIYDPEMNLPRDLRNKMIVAVRAKAVRASRSGVQAETDFLVDRVFNQVESQDAKNKFLGDLLVSYLR